MNTAVSFFRETKRINVNPATKIVAIGASSNDGNKEGNDYGHVRIFENINDSWVQIGNDIDGENAVDTSGSSISLSSDGTVIAIGAIYNNGLNGYGTDTTSVGHVRVYQSESSTLGLPSYALSVSSSSLSEGETLTTTLETRNLDIGTTFYWSISNINDWTNSINALDFVSGNLNGSGTIDINGELKIYNVIAADLTPEGDETFEISVFSDANRSIQIGPTFSIDISDPSVPLGQGAVISPNQSQYDMVRGKAGSFQDILISSGNQTPQGDVYIIPFIPNSYYWDGSNKSSNGGDWTFDLGDVDPADRILIDYPLGDLSKDELDQLWDFS